MVTRRTGASPLVVALAALVLSALSAPAAWAQRWDTYNNANRLNSVTATRGFVWCASDLGLHRYHPDTGRFTRFAKASGGLAANAVTEVEVDAAGNTWMATRGRGVSVLTPAGAWRTLSAFEGLPSDTVLCLEPSSVGMWVGTRRGAALFDGFELVAVWPDGVNPSPFASNEILDIAHLGDSTWVGTPGGAYVTRTDEGVTWSRRVGGLSGTDVRSLAGRNGEAWCVAGNSVFRGGQSGTWTPAGEGLPATPAYSIRAHGDTLLLGAGAGVFRRVGGGTWQLLGAGFPAQAWVDFADDGGIWAGNVEGPWRWDGAQWQRLEIPGPQGNAVVNLALEGSRVWISTRDRAIARFDGASWRTFAPQPGATRDTSLYSTDDVFMIFVDSRGLKWIGDWGHSISKLDDSGPVPAFTHYFSVDEGGFDIFNTFGWSTAEDPSGRVWMGLDTNNAGQLPAPYGLHRFQVNGARTTFNPQNGAAMSNSQVRAVAFAPGAGFEMWVGYAGSGVDIFTDPTLATRSGRITRDAGGLLDDDVWGIAFFGDSVWVANAAGLSRYSRATRVRLENIVTQPPTSRGAVHPLAIDAGGGVWWGTKSGLYHRRTDRSVQIYTAANSPLLSDDVRAVAVDHATGDVWIGTDLGVNRLSPGGGGGTPGGGAATFTTHPNPAFLSAAGVRLFSLGVSGPFTGRVYDVRGRVVRRLVGNASTSGLWDARDEEGRPVGPGFYILAVTQEGVTRTSRVLLVR